MPLQADRLAQSAAAWSELAESIDRGRIPVARGRREPGCNLVPVILASAPDQGGARGCERTLRGIRPQAVALPGAAAGVGTVIQPGSRNAVLRVFACARVNG